MVRQVVTVAMKPLLQWYLGRERKYSRGRFTLDVEPGVFPPGFFFSSKLLLRTVEAMDLRGKSFLELGAGNGLITIAAAAAGARVTATDISTKAVRAIERNAALNNVGLRILQSDVFERIPQEPFDVIAVNPPFYKKNPQRESEYAWYCGEGGEYYQRFFARLHGYTHAASDVVMVLSDDCDIGMVRTHAGAYGFALHPVQKIKKYWETFYIFEIRPAESAAITGPIGTEMDSPEEQMPEQHRGA